MSPAPLTTAATYPTLRRSVERVLYAGRRDIEAAWVRTYHEIGRLIQEHLLCNQKRAGYGAKLFTRLAHDVKVSSRTLHECVQFYLYYPIVRPVAQLGWNRCRLLCQVDDEPQRAALTAQARKHDWASGEIQRRVRELNAARNVRSSGAEGLADKTAAAPTADLLTPKRGLVGRYRVIALDDGLGLDLGFKLCRPLPPAQARHRTAGETVAVDAEGGVSAVADGKSTELFTYAATVRRVIDGDTLEVALALPGVVLRQKLRLRGLDCPEIDTPEGKTAKRRVEALVAAAKSVTVHTTKPDKYDRYLADVFLELAPGSDSQLSSLNSQPPEGPLFLNNHLLATGLAERKAAWEFGDWEKMARR